MSTVDANRVILTGENSVIRLGNTKLEWFLVTPLSSDPKKAHDPTTWTNWATSCHTCHGQASGQVVGNTMKFLDFTPSRPLKFGSHRKRIACGLV